MGSSYILLRRRICCGKLTVTVLVPVAVQLKVLELHTPGLQLLKGSSVHNLTLHAEITMK